MNRDAESHPAGHGAFSRRSLHRKSRRASPRTAISGNNQLRHILTPLQFPSAYDGENTLENVVRFPF